MQNTKQLLYTIIYWVYASTVNAAVNRMMTVQGSEAI